MSESSYLLFNLVIVASAFTMEWHSKVFKKLDKARLLLAYILVSAGFNTWDYWAVGEGHRGFNPAYITGVYLVIRHYPRRGFFV